ncbi:MAG: PD-(D/E)XK nuclease domain-containing protein, partial [Myxococcota bacterium]
VLEFKTCLRQSDSLDETAQKALRQIQEKRYHINLFQRGIKSVIALGLAFRGKEVAVTHRELSPREAEPIAEEKERNNHCEKPS